MAEKSLCATKFFPMDKDSFSEGSDAWEALNAGREVVLDKNGWILDVWDPVSKKTYDVQGNEIGTRNKPFVLPEKTEVRTTEFKVYTITDKDEFDPEGDIYGLLISNRQVTIDTDGKIMDIWWPEGKVVEDVEGHTVSLRDVPYSEYYDKEIRNPTTLTIFPFDRSLYQQEDWIWNYLNDGYQVSLDANYNVIDIWHPGTGAVIDRYGVQFSTRSDPYPTDTNIDETKRKYQALLSEIATLRNIARGQKGQEKLDSEIVVAAKLREYGRLVWLYGRLVHRRRKHNKYNDHKRSRSYETQEPTR